MMVSPDWLQYQAQVHPDHLALKTSDAHWSFAALDAEVARLAGVLSDRGVGAGDRVAYHLAADAPQVLLAHALTRLGAVLVPLNVRLTDRELTPILLDADPVFVVHDGRVPNKFAGKSCAINDLLASHPSQSISGRELRLDALHAVMYTSGTTGAPKGVELTLGNQWWSAVGFALNAGQARDDRWLHVMPLFHVGGLTILFRSVIQGTAVFLEPHFDAGRALALIASESVTLVSLVPTMLQRLLDIGSPSPPSLRMILLGGAPASPALIDAARSRGYPVASTYGMTETCSQIAIAAPDATDGGFSAGHPNLPTQVRIVVDGHRVPAGHPGEIWIHGPTVARGYWRNPAATREVFVDGWLRSGDVGTVDDRGYLTVTDRVKDLIIRGGENIFPREIEDALMEFPGMKDVAVFGRSHPEWGQEVAAAVVAEGPIDPDRIRRFLSNRLASYKIPSIYFAVQSIPRNAAGKILRTQLGQ